MIDPAIDRLRAFLLKGGLKDTVVTREDLAGIVQTVRGPSAEPQRIEALERLYVVAKAWCDHPNRGYARHLTEEGEALMNHVASLRSEPLATVPQGSARRLPPIEQGQEQAGVFAGGDGSIPRCAGCGGPHPFDTTVSSPLWNSVIRSAGRPEYLCLTCIVLAFAQRGMDFTAELWGQDFNGTPIYVRFNGEPPVRGEGDMGEVERLRTAIDAARRESASDPESRWARNATIILNEALRGPSEHQKIRDALRYQSEEHARLEEPSLDAPKGDLVWRLREALAREHHSSVGPEHDGMTCETCALLSEPPTPPPAPDPQRGALQAIHKHFPPWVWSRFNTREQVQFETLALDVIAAALSAAKAPTGGDVLATMDELHVLLAEARAAIKDAARFGRAFTTIGWTNWRASPAVRAALGETS